MSQLRIGNNQMQMKTLKRDLEDTSTVAVLQKRLDEAEKSGEPPFRDFTDMEMMKWFLNERRHVKAENDRSERTVLEYERELMLFIQQLLSHSAEIDIDVDYIIDGSLFKSLQSRHLRRYQDWLDKESPHVLMKGAYSPATFERKTTIIRAFFRFLYDKAYIKEPIHNGLRIASVRPDDRPNRDLGPAEVIKLLNAFRDRTHPVMFTIIHVLTTTGIRNEEFCTLKVQDLKVDAIQGGYYIDVLGKGNKRRQIPLKEKVVRSIRMFRHARGLLAIEAAEPSEPLFTTSTGRSYSPSYLSQYVKKEIVKLKHPDLSDKSLIITPHVFRHAFAIISNLNGVAIQDIMRSLGHEKLETTMIYLEKVFAKERHAIHAWKPGLFGDYI